MDNYKQESFKSGVPTVLYFSATWCQPCKQLGPVIENIANSRQADGISFWKILADDEKSLLTEYGVRSIPTLVLLKEGKEFKRLVGAQPASAINLALDLLMEDDF